MKAFVALLLLTPFMLAATPPVASVPFSDIGPQQTEVPAISLLRLERSSCLTRCPAFSVTIRRDGSFTYSGEDAVERLGEHRGRVERGELEQILRYLGEIDFMALSASYPSPYLDNSSSTITVVQDGRRKAITTSAGSGPATLWALEKLIDGLLESATWDAQTRAP